MTLEDDLKRSAARSIAIIISGIPELNTQTPIAAKITEIFAAISFREHSNTELMFMSSFR
jgi:hypothetical protein